ncbi:MAG: radical SAM protein [Acidimicrobiia bacterium]|nr:radical SAM protein [Acidimicrobiia bacterium]
MTGVDLEPPTDLQALDEIAGFRTRRTNFGDRMDFFAPGLKRWETREWRPGNSRRFLPVSVTGDACALQCDHCQSKVLKGMISVAGGVDLFERARRLQAEGTDGILVSGGSTRTGGVPLARHLDAMGRIRDELGMQVVVHSGVADATLARGLADVGVDAVMLDIIGADETIREVYHLDLTTDDFERSLAVLAEHDLRIIPHIVLGMHYGRFLGEQHALEMIARYPVSTLILVVLVPLVGTPMESVPPPPLEDVVEFFAVSRQTLPTTTINLGCGRPMGAMKTKLDMAAIDNGLNGIAYPADGAIAYARRRGLETNLYEYCCSMTWAGEPGQAFREIVVDL